DFAHTASLADELLSPSGTQMAHWTTNQRGNLLPLPSHRPLPVATKMAPLAESMTAPVPPQIPEPDCEQDAGSMSPGRFLHREFHTDRSLPLAQHPSRHAATGRGA